jgi:pheromone shutdown-related protein TraB
VLRDGDRTVWVLGTAHVSRRSVDDVERLIRAVRPDSVCVELDSNRYQALVDETRWRDLDIFEVIRQRRVPFLLAMLLLSAYQARIGERFGVRPGAELLAACREAKAAGATLVLADRDVQTTIRRTWRTLGWRERIKLALALAGGLFSDDEISEEELESFRERHDVAGLIEELAETFPGVKGPLIDERDAWLASEIEQAAGPKVVAVVGAAHVPGILNRYGEPHDRASLERIPKTGRLGRMLKWLLPAIVLAAFAVGFRRHAGEGLAEMVWAWILPNAIFAALFSLLAGARLLSVGTALVASPITSLNPTIAAGFVVGLVEAWLRRPTVGDCERLREDAQTVRGWYRNRFTRVLLVSAAASVGSALGAWIGGTWVITLLGS